MPNSTYTRRKRLNHQYRSEEWEKIANVYVGIHGADPTPDTATALANEIPPGVNGIARAVIPVADAEWTAPATVAGAEEISNVDPIVLGTATADLNGGDPVTHWSHWDAPTGGNLLRYGEIADPRSFLTGDTVQIPAGGALLGEM